MNNDPTRVLFALFVFGSMLMSLACGTKAPETNQADANKAGRAHPCPDTATVEQKKINLTTRIREEIDDNNKLKKQSDDGLFAFEVFTFSTKPLIGIKVQGSFRGKGKGDNETTLENFLDIIDDFLREGCIQKVTVVPPAEEPGLLRSEGFEWALCEHPNVYCPDGQCLPPGSCMAVSNTNANTPLNSNANSNSSSNSNANSNSNARVRNY